MAEWEPFEPDHDLVVKVAEYLMDAPRGQADMVTAYGVLKTITGRLECGDCGSDYIVPSAQRDGADDARASLVRPRLAHGQVRRSRSGTGRTPSRSSLPTTTFRRFTGGVMKWHAGIGDSDFLRRYARLYVGQELPDGQMKVLLEDGTFTTVEREVHSERAGLVLPYEALTAVFEALESWKGLQSHQATEAKVLREWLDAERARVDRLMERHSDGGDE